MANDTNAPRPVPPQEAPVQWPNREPVIEGILPGVEVSQDPELFADDDDDPELEMED